MRAFRLTLVVAFVLFSSVVLAQKGTIRGTVTDGETGETLFGVTVVIEGTTNGAATDFDGKFEIKAEPGTYNVQASFISFKTVTITGVAVQAGEVATLSNIQLFEDIGQLEEVVVTAEAIRNTESALLTIKKKSTNLLDGISSQTFKRSGDSDAASAIKRVPGVSTQGGKYVVVRGLGDRYTKTILNNVDIPGLDPDRNSLQMDLFPTSLIDNIVVVKSFTADLPADFTGGVVNIETKDFPEEKTITLSASVGFNPDMHLKSDYLTYSGSGTDFLGFDDGTRDLPFDSRNDIPAPQRQNPELTRITSLFNAEMATSQKTSLPNMNLSFTLGNQVQGERYTFGYNAAISYRNETTFFQDLQSNNVYRRDPNPEVLELRADALRSGSRGENSSLLSGLVGLAVKTDKSKLKFNALHIQNGVSRSAEYLVNNIIISSNTTFRDVLDYTERSITNLMLGGEHLLEGPQLEINWKLSPTFSQINDKDIRDTPFTDEEGVLSIQPSEGGDPQRLWRFLDEQNYVAKVDFTKKYIFGGEDAKLRFGLSETYKERDFEIQAFRINLRREDQLSINGDPNQLLAPENIWTVQSGAGSYLEGDFQPNNEFSGRMNIAGAYVSNEFQVTQKLKSIIGLRVEQFNHFYTGADQQFASSGGQSGRFFDDEEVLNTFNLFPTANIVYSLKDNQNLRISYARTVARPSFKEKSNAQIVDPISNTTFIGNIDLIETDIDNFDIRWEAFQDRGQTVAFSVFYKHFTNPIELIAFAEATDNIRPENVGDADVLGVEAELRKRLDFISPALSSFSFNVNASVISSEVAIDDREREAKEPNLREGETLGETRDMVGQSPYIINLGLSYDNLDNGIEAGMFYNVQGETLALVGIASAPDVYTQPFHSLNFNLLKRFGTEQNSQIGLGVSNILGDVRESFTSSFGSSAFVVNQFAPGTSFTLRFRHNF